MKVTGLWFQGPGRGEFLRKEMDLPDHGFPKDARSCSERSVKAIKHMWPSIITGICLKVRVQKQRFIAEGMHWQVEWMTDAMWRKRHDFLSRLYRGEATTDELFTWAQEYETEMDCPMTQE